jgi:hypothetical protein
MMMLSLSVGTMVPQQQQPIKSKLAPTAVTAIAKNVQASALDSFSKSFSMQPETASPANRSGITFTFHGVNHHASNLLSLSRLDKDAQIMLNSLASHADKDAMLLMDVAHHLTEPVNDLRSNSSVLDEMMDAAIGTLPKGVMQKLVPVSELLFLGNAFTTNPKVPQELRVATKLISNPKALQPLNEVELQQANVAYNKALKTEMATLGVLNETSPFTASHDEEETLLVGANFYRAISPRAVGKLQSNLAIEHPDLKALDFIPKY